MSPSESPEEQGVLDTLKRVHTAGWVAGRVLVAVVVAVVVVLLLSGSDSDEGEGVSFTGSGYPNVDLSNTRQVKGGSLKAATVADLEAAWTLPLTAESSFGSYAASAGGAHGVISSQDLASTVQASAL